MKKEIMVSIILGIAFISPVHPQDGAHDGGRFVKRLEYNLIALNDIYNLDSKGDLEKLFFGDFNAKVEFLYDSHSDRDPGASGFRIVKGKSNTSCILEVKYISNYEEASKEASKTHYSMGALGKQYEEMLKLFKIESHFFPISNQFADELYKKMVSCINNFKAKGVPPLIRGGYSVVFRNVVGDEVWSLNIHMPKGDSLKMADLCRQIIMDAKTNKLDEKKYISILNTFESQ